MTVLPGKWKLHAALALAGAVAILGPASRPALAQESPAPAASATPSPAPLPAGKVPYLLIVRGHQDTLVEVEITRGDRFIVIGEVSRQRYPVVVPSYSAAAPMVNWYTSTTLSALQLTVDFTLYSFLHSRGDLPESRAFGAWNGIQSPLEGDAPSARDAMLVEGTKHFVLINGTEIAGLIALPAQLTSWHDERVTAVGPQLSEKTLYTVSTPPVAVRPKGVAAADFAMQFDGKEHLVEWVDPLTLLPDRIDIPSQRAVIVRADRPY
jgi:hypothetical protein